MRGAAWWRPARGALWAGLDRAGHLLSGGRLGGRELESALLRAAAALRAGAEALEHGTHVGGPLTEAEDALVRAADELISHGEIPDALWAELARLVGESQRLELVLLIGHYAMMTTILASDTRSGAAEDPAENMAERTAGVGVGGRP